MPSVSKSQHGAAGIALAAKRGEIPKERLKGAAKRMFESMSADELEKFASTKTKNLPKHAGRGRRIRAARSA